jgi:hypothetical protein
MARTIYSTRFLSLGITNQVVDYVVPDGYVAVVRSVTAVILGGPTACVGSLQLGGTRVPVVFMSNVNGNDQKQIEMRQVVNAEETIRITASSGNTIYWAVSGYLLTL